MEHHDRTRNGLNRWAALLPALALAALGGCSDNGVHVPENGVWHGYIDGENYEAVTLNVQDGTITADGSTLDNDAALIVKVPYSNVTITSYIHDDIDISANTFTFTRGDITSASGRLTVEGTFTTSDHLTGSVSHTVDSWEWNGQLDYEWSAER